MSYQTAWARKASSLPSDRISPKTSAGSARGAKGKQKEVPKSVQVKRLEKLLDGLKNTTGSEKDPKGGCFCQARVHELSPYAPICKQCGLILCSLNMPHHVCPSCSSPLLSANARESVIARLETEIADAIQKEEQERKRVAEEAREAAGAFPTLSGSVPPPIPTSSSSSSLDGHPVNQSHKVLSLNSKTKKIKVSSFSTPPPSTTSLKKERESPVEKLPPRVLRPPAEVVFSANASADRPWARLGSHGDEVVYIPPVKTGSQDQGSSKGRRKKGARGQDSTQTQGKGKE